MWRFNHEKIKSILSTSISKLEVDTVIWTQNFHLLRLGESSEPLSQVTIKSLLSSSSATSSSSRLLNCKSMKKTSSSPLSRAPDGENIYPGLHLKRRAGDGHSPLSPSPLDQSGQAQLHSTSPCTQQPLGTISPQFHLQKSGSTFRNLTRMFHQNIPTALDLSNITSR